MAVVCVLNRLTTGSVRHSMSTTFLAAKFLIHFAFVVVIFIDIYLAWQGIPSNAVWTEGREEHG